MVATLETKNVCIAEDFAEEIGLSYGQYVNHRVSKVSRNNTKICSLLNPTSSAMGPLKETRVDARSGCSAAHSDHKLFRSGVVEGLSRLQKTIPYRWLCDERGSDLFEEITRLEDYYPTRAETAILRAR